MAANTFCGFRSFFCLLIFAISTVKTFAQLCNQYTFRFHYFLLFFSSTFNTFSIRHFHRTLLFQSDMCFTSSDGFATGSSTPHSNLAFVKYLVFREIEKTLQMSRDRINLLCGMWHRLQNGGSYMLVCRASHSVITQN